MNILLYQSLREHIISQLSSIGKQRGDEIIILCPFHNDSRPSLGVHVGDKVTPGSFHCFSCKAHGGWNKLADKLNLKKIEIFNGGNNKADPSSLLPEKTDPFQMLSKFVNESKILVEDKPKNLIGLEDLPDGFSWRGLGKSFLVSVGAKYYWQQEIDMDWLYFPLYMNGVYTGYTTAALKPHDPKYMTFANTHNCCFLYDLMPNGESIVLVEGHFDALRLYAEGIYTIAIFGTSNWSTTKTQLLAAKNPKKVIIAMDGDEAGYKATEEIFNDLKYGFNVDIFWFPLGYKLDPGNMPDSYVEALRTYL